MASALKTLRGTLKRLTLPLVAVILALTAISVVYSVNIGSETLDSDAVWQVVISHLNGTVSDDPAVEAIVWELRLPRALLSVIVGAGLGIAGCGMQTLVRNPLADPYLLGVSAGASVGATAVITFGVLSGFGLWSISVGALLGSLGAALAVYLVAMAQGGLTPIRLVLSGVVLLGLMPTFCSMGLSRFGAVAKSSCGVAISLRCRRRISPTAWAFMIGRR